MSGNANNLRIGDVDVYLDDNSGAGEVHLGHTLGGVELSFEREFEDLTVDQYGNMPLDMALTGQNLLIKATLAEITNKNISRAIPEGNYAQRVSGATVADSKLGVGRDSGFLLSTVAGILRLHPRKNVPSNLDEDIYIFKAVSSETVELAYKIDEQRVLEITFRALVDESQQNGYRLGRVGNDPIS